MRTIHGILDNVIIHKSRVTLGVAGGGRGEAHAALLAAVPPGGKPHRAAGGRSPRTGTRNHRVPAIADSLERDHRDLAARFDIGRRVLWAT